MSASSSSPELRAGRHGPGDDAGRDGRRDGRDRRQAGLRARRGRPAAASGAPRATRASLPAGGIAEQQRAGNNEPSAAIGPANAARPSAGVASGNGPNRGVSVVGNRVIFTSDDGYLIAVNRLTGGVMGTVPLTDPEIRRALLCDAGAFGDRRPGDLRRVGRRFLDARLPRRRSR